MECIILCGLVWFSIVLANVFLSPCKVSNGLVWPYAAMHNCCACFKLRAENISNIHNSLNSLLANYKDIIEQFV